MVVLKYILEDQIIREIEEDAPEYRGGKILIDDGFIYIEAIYNMYPDYCSCEILEAVRVLDEKEELYESISIDTEYIVQKLYKDIRDGQALYETEIALSMSF